MNQNNCSMKFLVSKKVGQKSEYIHENAITHLIYELK